MTDEPTGKAGADASRRFLETSARGLRDVLEAVDEATRRARFVSEPGEEGLAATILELARTRAMVIREIRTDDKRNQLSGDGSADDSFDFDAVRDQIGRQLDRLRDARGTEGLS